MVLFDTFCGFWCFPLTSVDGDFFVAGLFFSFFPKWRSALLFLHSWVPPTSRRRRSLFSPLTSHSGLFSPNGLFWEIFSVGQECFEILAYPRICVPHPELFLTPRLIWQCFRKSCYAPSIPCNVNNFGFSIGVIKRHPFTPLRMLILLLSGTEPFGD